MASLHDLAMATRAAQLLPSPHLAQVIGVWSKGMPWKSTLPESKRVSWHPERRQLASGTSAAGRGPWLCVTYLANCTNPSIFPRTSSATPGGKWHWMQATLLWLDSCQDL